MAQFAYKSMDRFGQPSQGSLEASSLSAAAQIIRSRGQVVLSIDEGAMEQAVKVRRKFMIRGVRLREVAEFARRLATLLKAGVGVVEGLETIREAQTKGPIRPILAQMAERIRSGFSLSEALAEHPETFPPIAENMVAAAEASGELPAILIRLAEHIEKRLQVREAILMAVLYPCIVLFLTLAVLVVMLTWVFPTIEKFLHSQHLDLPPLAQALMSTADFTSSWGAAMLAGFAAILLVILVAYRTPRGKRYFQRKLLKLPLLGKAFHSAATQVWTRTLGDLLESGLSLQESLAVTARVVPNLYMGDQLQIAREKVIGGSSFGESLATTSPLFDHMVCKLVKVGENAGTLEEALADISQFAEEELRRRVTFLAKLFEPVVIIFVGLVVGVVFIACFQAIYGYLPNR